MADIRNQINQISTAFYGGQVRSSMVEGLEAINDEVNGMYDEFGNMMSKATNAINGVNDSQQQVEQLEATLKTAENNYDSMYSSAEQIINNLNLKSQYIMANQTALTGQFASDFNTALTNGCYSYASTEGTKNIPQNCGFGVLEVIVGATQGSQTEFAPSLNNWIWQIAYDTSGIIVYRNAVNSTWSDWMTIATTSNETFENCTLNSTNLSGSVTLVGETAIQGGAIQNTILAGTITNEATISGGTIQNVTLTGANSTNERLEGDTTVSGQMIIGNESGEIIFQNQKSQNMLAFNPENDEFLMENLFTNVPLFKISPVQSGYDTVNCRCNIQLNEDGGNIYYTNAQNQNIIESSVNNSTYEFQNAITGNPMISVEPVSSGADTINVMSEVQLNNIMTCSGGINAGINFETLDKKYNIGIGSLGNEDIFTLYDNTNNNSIYQYNPETKGLSLFNTIIEQLQNSNIEGQGYFMLGGLIVNWGSFARDTTAPGTASFTVSLPQAYTTRHCFNMAVTCVTSVPQNQSNPNCADIGQENNNVPKASTDWIYGVNTQAIPSGLGEIQILAKNELHNWGALFGGYWLSIGF